MRDLVLHHFDLSPFAEKIRLGLGLKQLAWRSVQIPMIMPKPDLMPLTGGYRKTPVLQIGADVYCDTSLIARELERRFPDPTFFPSGGQGLAYALGCWSDKAFFEPGAGLSMGENKDIPDPVLADRIAFFNFMDFDVLDREIPHLYSQLMAHVALIEAELADGRPYLSGDQPGLIDINAYFPVWMSRGNIPKAGEVFATLGKMAEWEGRMRAIGHGSRQELDVGEALEIAKRSEPAAGRGVQAGEPLGLKAGQAVSVSPDDYGRDPVQGTVATADVVEIAVRRHDPLVGDVIVHFPRMGYRILIS